jgi:putative SOS response-associated peptidase YedK
MHGGLIPFEAQDPKIGYKTINARAETVAIKPALRDAFKARHWLMPATGVYKWKRDVEPK